MAKKSSADLAKQILENIGGEANVRSASNCATRLRFFLHDDSKLNEAGLKAIDEVLGIVKNDDQYQVILGPGTAGKVGMEFAKLSQVDVPQIDDAETLKADIEKRKNNTSTKRFLKHLSNIFIPLIPAFVGCGITYGMAKLLLNLGWIGDNTYAILYVIGKSIFVFMNIMVGMYTAKEFGGTIVLGGAIAGILSGPGLAKVVINGENLIPEQGGVIAVLIAAMLGAMLEKKIRKFMPSIIDLIATPTLVLLIIGIGSIYIIHPLGVWLTGLIATAVNWLIDTGGILVGAILSGTFLPLVMTGLHRAITPIEVSLLKETGIDLLRPILAMAGAGQVGAAIAVYMKTKNKQLKKIIGSSLPIGILGVGEPLIFGVTLPLGKPFLTACLGAVFGGAYVSVMKISSVGIGLSGLPLTLLISEGQKLHYLIGILLAYAGGFVLTYFTKWNDMPEGSVTGGLGEDSALAEILHLDKK